MATKQQTFIIELNSFRTLNTKDSAISMRQDELPAMENFMPVGSALWSVPGFSVDLVSLSSRIVRHKWFNIGEQYGTMIAFCSDGSLWKVNDTFPSLAWSSVQLAPVGTFTDPKFVQWKNQTILIIDPTAGYWYYSLAAHTDTSGEVFLAGFHLSSAAQVGTAIAVFKGHVFVANGRTLNYTAPDFAFDFVGAGSGTTIDTYEDLGEGITELIPTQDYLYVIGDLSTHLIYGVQILSDGTVTFNMTDAVPMIGSMWKESCKAYANQVIMATQTGINQVSGTSYAPASEYLDGLFPLLDFQFFAPVANFATVFNKTIYCLLVIVKQTATQPAMKKLLCFYQDSTGYRWFVVNYGLELSSLSQRNLKTGSDCFAARDNTIIKLFTGRSVMTKTFTLRAEDFGYPVNDKAVVNAGVQITNVTASVPSFTAALTILGELSSVPAVITFNLPSGPVSPNVFVADASHGFGAVEGRGRKIQAQFTETSDAMYVVTGVAYECTLGPTWPEPTQDANPIFA